MEWLHYKLHQNYIKYRDQPIPAIVFNMDHLLKSIDTRELYNIILAKSYYSIMNVADFPEINHDGRMYRSTAAQILKESIDIRLFSREERIHLAMIAVLNLIERYKNRNHSFNILRYIARSLPLYYVRELKKNLPVDIYELPDMIYIDEEPEVRNNTILPLDVRDYINTYLKENITEYSEKHCFYTRMTLYRLISSF